jgi:putative RNA 2'-phosphotransferase
MANSGKELINRVGSVITEAATNVVEFARLIERDDPSLVGGLAFLLRHGGPARGVTVDPEGWAALQDVVRALRKMNRQLNATTGSAVVSVVRSQESERFEIAQGRIRALYGHTLPGVVAARPAIPPTRLFHGTAAENEPRIREEGILPMRRGYVHLTSDLGYALQVARACGKSWIVLRLRATDAADSGVEFLTTAGHVWLASAIRPDFLDSIPVARG